MKHVTVGAVKKSLRRWMRALGFNSMWKVDIAINYKPEQCEPEHREAQAAILTNEGYFIADLKVNAYNIAPGELDDVIRHEVCHIAMAQVETALQAAYQDRYWQPIEALLEAAVERFSTALGKNG